MTGRYNYTAPINSDAFDPPADFADVYAFFDTRLGEQVASAASLPAAATRPGGHLVSAADTKIVYLNVASTSWSPVAGPDAVGSVAPAAGTVTVGATSRVRRDYSGLVTGKIYLGRATVDGGIVNNTVFGIVSSGFRPTETVRANCVVLGTTSTDAFMQIETSGNVRFFFTSATPTNPVTFTGDFSYIAA